MTQTTEAIALDDKTNKVPHAGDVNNFLGRGDRDRDFLYIAEDKRKLSGETVRMEWDGTRKAVTVKPGRAGLPQTARYISPVVSCKFPAVEFLPSWNIDLPDILSQGFTVTVRVFNNSGKASPWFFLGEGGASGKGVSIKKQAAGWGKTFIDYLALQQPAVSFQYRIDFTLADKTQAAPGIRRFFMHYSGQGKVQPIAPRITAGNMIRVKVPYRSQLDVEDVSLRDHVCCPTCVAMVLQQYGIHRPTMHVCDAVYSRRYDMHGIWPQASQAAYQFGCRAWVDRFRSMDAVRTYLESGRAIIASIRVGEGQLRHARYPRSNGHLIVITGLKKDKVLVNDPYSAGPKGAEIEYESEDIEKVWLDRGGVAILIENTK